MTSINPTRNSLAESAAPRNVVSNNVAQTVTMSSREISELTGKQHKDVIRDIRATRKALEDDGADLRHLIEVTDSRGYTAEFRLDRDLTETVITGYSIPLRYKVIKRLRELENQSASRQSVTVSGTKVVGELAILECFTRLLRPAPSSQMMMLAKIAANNGLESNFLPGYAVDADPDSTGGSSMESKPVTALLKANGIAITAPCFNRLLAAAGYIKKCQRNSSKRGIVDFWSVAEKGLRFGKNLTSPSNPRETQPHWYVDRFVELASLIGVAL